MPNPSLPVRERLASAAVAFYAGVPTLLLLWLALTWMSYLFDWPPPAFSWMVLGELALVVGAFFFPAIILELFGYLWRSLLVIYRWFVA